MVRCGRSDGAAVAVNEVFSVLFAKAGRAAQFLENAECSINSLFAGFAFQLAQMFVCHGSTRCPHSSAQISWLNLAREYRHQKGNQSSVCLRKKLFGFRAESIRSVRFADAGLHA